MQTDHLQNKQLYHVQALRGVAALMVMLAHLYDAEVKYSYDQLFGAWSIYGNIGVDLFFVISGFIMVYVTWNRPRGIKAAVEFLFGRIWRIYPLYWAVSLAVLGIFLVRPELVFSSREISPILWKSFLLFPDVVSPLLLVGWTLIFEMYFYLIFTGIMLFKRNLLLPALALWAAIILIGRQLGWHEHTSVTEIIFNPLAFEFLIGAVLAYIFQKKQTLISSIFESKNISYLGFCIIAIWAVLFLVLNDFPNIITHRVLVFITPVTLLVGYAVMRDQLNLKVWRPLITLGDWSYSLYLTHILSIAVIGRIWKNFMHQSPFDNVLALIIMTAFSIAVSGMAYALIEKPIINTSRKIRDLIF